MKIKNTLLRDLHSALLGATDTIDGLSFANIGDELREKGRAFDERLNEVCEDIKEFDDVSMEIADLNTDYEAFGFAVGFKLGARLMAEVFCNE